MSKWIPRLTLALFLAFSTFATAKAESHVYKLYVDGLACPFCAYGVEKMVGGLDGVKSIDIDIDEGVVKVTMKGKAKLDHEVAKKAVDDAGFSLGKFLEPSEQS